jgi:D-alanine-D-alanine ligase-like ATP-grasp enzyme
MEATKGAFISCKGTGYARADIRRDSFTGKPYVLEINAVPGIGAESCSDYLLKLQGETTKEFIGKFLSRPTFDINTSNSS